MGWGRGEGGSVRQRRGEDAKVGLHRGITDPRVQAPVTGHAASGEEFIWRAVEEGFNLHIPKHEFTYTAKGELAEQRHLIQAAYSQRTSKKMQRRLLTLDDPGPGRTNLCFLP